MNMTLSQRLDRIFSEHKCEDWEMFRKIHKILEEDPRRVERRYQLLQAAAVITANGNGDTVAAVARAKQLLDRLELEEINDRPAGVGV